MCATGIPPHIVLASEVAKLRADFNQFDNNINQRLDGTPDAVKRVLLDNFQIDGTIPTV
jgi:hypothetical protein